MLPLSLVAFLVSAVGSAAVVGLALRPDRRRKIRVNLTYQLEDGSYGSVEGAVVPLSYARALIKKLERAHGESHGETRGRLQPA